MVQDYLPQVTLSSAGGLNMTHWVHDANNVQPAGIVPEMQPKPFNGMELKSTTIGLEKIAIAEYVTLEALLSVGQETLLDALESLLLLRIEDAIHEQIVNRIGSYAMVFNATPYANSVLYANYIDTIYLTIQQEKRIQVYESPRVKSDVDLVLIPKNYYERLGVLKNAIGQRLYNSYEEAFGDNVKTLSYGNNISTDFGFVVRSAEVKFVVLNEVFVSYVLAHPNQNMGVLVVDVFFNVIGTERVEQQTRWYVRQNDLNVDTQTINLQTP